MDAQLILVMGNGYAEAREPRLRNRYEVVDIPDKKDIKTVIWRELCRIGRQGHVVVKWQGQKYVCEMREDKTGYSRVEVDYHPYGDRFSI